MRFSDVDDDVCPCVSIYRHDIITTLYYTSPTICNSILYVSIFWVYMHVIRVFVYIFNMFMYDFFFVFCFCG